MLEIKNPETVYISFKNCLPNYFELFDNLNNKVYYFRYLDGKTPRIKFNICHPCLLSSNVDFEVVKKEKIKTPYNLPKLPIPDRNRVKDFSVVFNEELEGTPACIYTADGIIEVGNEFLSFPRQIQGFLYAHEFAHFFYSNEFYCDVFALVSCLRKGYNRSLCFYALSNILCESSENIKRVYSLFEKIQETQKTRIL